MIFLLESTLLRHLQMLDDTVDRVAHVETPLWKKKGKWLV